MADQISRRDFLNLGGAFSAALSMPASISNQQESAKPNILVLIFDSWSASNTSLYGYPRNTTPAIDRWADRAIVYHNHYASGHYTYPSTASLFTGRLPWAHQGYWDKPSEEILPIYSDNNIFAWMEDYYRIGYTNNSLAGALLRTVASNLETHVPLEKLTLPNHHWISNLFENDSDTALVAWTQAFDLEARGIGTSAFLSRVFSEIKRNQDAKFSEQFPRGLPQAPQNNSFFLETAIDWIIESTHELPEPFFSYMHLLPPHSPYNTRADFIDAFKDDGFSPPQKPFHQLGQLPMTFGVLTHDRRMYDEYLLYVDSEFNRMMEALERKGTLENTVVVLTSDHGEMFERGIPEHLTPSFHQPLMHIPLLVFLPGMENRVDIHELTTTVDLLPTILTIAGKKIPDGLEGIQLPPFNPDPETDRTIYACDFRRSPKTGPLTDGTIMMKRGNLKFTYIFGTKGKYEKLDSPFLIEIYDLENDPEELVNLFDPNSSLTGEFLSEMNAKLDSLGLVISQPVSLLKRKSSS